MAAKGYRCCTRDGVRPPRPSVSVPGKVREFRHQTFSALANPNYRRYFVGQSISLVGTWMQTVAQGWLVLATHRLRHRASACWSRCRRCRCCLLGPYAGVVADRVDKRRLMIWLQAMMGVLAAVLGLLTVTGTVGSGTSWCWPSCSV